MGDLVGIVLLSVHNMSTQTPITPLNQGFNLYTARTTHMQHVGCHACGAQRVKKCLEIFVWGERHIGNVQGLKTTCCSLGHTKPSFDWVGYSNTYAQK
jgi:hypothetical protein